MTRVRERPRWRSVRLHRTADARRPCKTSHIHVHYTALEMVIKSVEHLIQLCRIAGCTSLIR
jgi:hypothetical protein